jgi:hypothetical protein
MTITLDQMRPKLLTVEQLYESFSKTEPLSQITFTTDSVSKVKFKLGPAWAIGLDNLDGTDVVPDVEMKVGTGSYQLTKDCMLQATSMIGLPKNFVTKSPANLLEPLLNWHYHAGMTNKSERKLLAAGSTGLAVTTGSIVPFSNLKILDEATAAIKEHFGQETEILADFKFAHDLRKSHVRLIIPDTVVQLRADDQWCGGVQWKNFLSGEKPTSFNAYMFRWICLNGQTSVHACSGNYNRRTGGQGDEFYEWARQVVDECLGGLENEFNAISAMSSEPLEGEVADVLSNIFSTYKVPPAVRTRIIENMVESDDLTAYGVLAAVTEAANASDLSAEQRDRLLQIGGALPHALTNRCQTCHRINLN